MTPREPSIDTIIDACANQFGVRRRDILSARRQQDVALARHAGMWLAREMTSLSYPVIGRLFGHRDHTTAMYGVSRIEALIASGHGVAQVVAGLKASLMTQEAA